MKCQTEYDDIKKSGREEAGKPEKLRYIFQISFTKTSSEFDVILVDCITLWVNNILHGCHNTDTVVDDTHIKRLCGEWLEKTKNFFGTVICVTNEVGLGIVPDNALARTYRDLVGTCNQLIGKTADQVVLVSCGVPLFIKK